MLQYFLYNTNYGNTIVDRSDTSFAPVSPFEEIYIDFTIPEIQPLYLYANSGGTGGTIIVNSQEMVDIYVGSTELPPTVDGNVTYGEFTGTTASLSAEIAAITGYTATAGLQEITNIGASTTVESTFSGGIKTGHIRPTGNTTTAVQIRNAGNTSIVNVDTVSGFTGFKTTAPKGLVHAYGTDATGDLLGTQSNAFIIDGALDVDKDIQWAENGVPKWLAETYRNEGGDFWYLYNVESGNSPLTIMETGRIGINKQTNIIDYHAVVVVGGGSDDLVLSGVYTQNYNSVYEIEIVASGSPDTYRWRKSIDNGITYGSYSPISACTLTAVELEYGVLVNFESTTGHVAGQLWRFAAFSQIPQGTFTIAPMSIPEIQKTNNYNAGVIQYQDITSIGNGGLAGEPFTVFNSGTGGTIQALYIGFNVEVNSVYLNINTVDTTSTLITEYWDGVTSGWTAMNFVNNNLLDGTDNLKKSGRIIWSPDTMSGWIRSFIPDKVEEGYELLWIRFRTSTNPSTTITLNSISTGNDIRFAIYSAFNDYKPSFFVNAAGAVNIGGGAITRKNKLQISEAYFLDTIVGSGSIFETDSEDPQVTDTRLKLSSNDACSTGIAFVKTRGTLLSASGVQNGDELGHIWFRARVGSTGATLNSITSKYVGDGSTTSLKGDLVFNTANNGFPIERVRIDYAGNTGFGITPTAVVHVKAGTTSTAPLRFTSGALLSAPQAGAVEFLGDKYYGTTTGDTRNTFAFLESPVFSGNVSLPSGTLFADGIAVNRIRPLNDGLDTLKIVSATGGTVLVTFNSQSGFTGFGTIIPETIVHTYGDDITAADGWNYQTNGIRVDGGFASDKDIQWFSEGQPKFTAQIYRCENGKYWYLSSPQSHINQLTVSETGRIGINNQTNIMNYHAILDAGGPNDMKTGGYYTQNYTSVYQVEIDSITGATDTFKWRKSKNEGQTYNGWSSSIALDYPPFELEYGVTISWEVLTGHSLGTRLIFTAFSQLPVGTLVVTPSSFPEVQTTLNWTATGTSLIYNDVTGEANSSTFGEDIKVFETGTTLNAVYFGAYNKLNSVFINLSQFGAGTTLIVEYWTGSVWENLTLINNSYVDGTFNLTQSGGITWETSSMTNWIPAYLPEKVEDGYDLYWIRLRTSTNPTIAPIAISFARNGNYRVAVLSSPFDFKPSMYVDSLGRTSIGGGNITGKNQFQINSVYQNIQSTLPTIMEIDSQDSTATDLGIKLTSNNDVPTGINIGKSRGCLANPLSSETGDCIGHITFRTVSNNGTFTLADISTIYTGNGTTQRGDMVFSTANGSNATEMIRMSSSGTTGFGVSPTAVVHVKAGTTSIAPLRFTSGTLLSSPQAGAVEFLTDAWYGTISTGSARKTFAFLESPVFIGAPELPVGTTLNSQSLCNYILNSGGTNSSTLLQKTTFSTYTGTTAPATYKTITSVNFYTGTTAPATYVTKSVFNAFTGATAPIRDNFISGATNGLSKPSVHVVELGGNLTKNTVITGSTFDLTLSSKALNLRAANGINICDNSSAGIVINTNNGDVTVRGNNVSGVEKTKFLLSDTQVIFTDSRATATGIEYNADYSTNFTARSLVDKAYVDANSGGGGVIVKTAVALATTGNIGLSGLTTVDGVQTVTGTRVLAKNQSTGANNGVYSASTGVWGRVGDFNETSEVVNGSYFFVNSGATNAKTSWVLTTPDPINVGVDTLTFQQFSSSSGVIQGNGICVTQSGGNYNVAVKLPVSCSALCSDSTGLYVNCSIAGLGLNYDNTIGVVNLDGSGLAGNSISWTGSTFNVNPATGTLATALNSKTNTSVFNIYTGATQAIYNNTLDPTGFINQDSIIVTYSIANRTINLSATTGTIQYYWRGILYDLGTSWTSAAHTNDTQGWYLYSTDGTNITWSTTGWQFSDLQVASRPPDVTFALSEVHGTMPYSTHEELHDVIGTYVDAGFGLTSGTYAIQPAVPTNANNTPSFDAGIIQDEDLHTTIVAWNQGSYTLAYFPNTTNVTFETGVTSIFRTGTTYPLINSWDGTSFSSVEMTNGYFANWYAFRIPVASDAHSQLYRLFIVQPQYQYTTLLAAQGESVASLQLSGLKNNFAEYVPVERITLGAKVNYSGATGRVRIEAQGILVANKFGQVGNIGGFSTTASNISVSPTSPFTSTNLQNLSDEYATAITARLTIANFNSFTGTTLPANYYTKTQINAYTGATATAISLKAPITSPTFLVSARSVTPAVNDNSTCIVTTAWYLGQCGTALPVMNGTANAGTSTLWTKQDHVHPSDTTRVPVATFNTYTGTTAPAAFASKSFVSNYTGTTAPATYLSRTAFNTYSGTTVPANYYNKTQINSYTGTTATAIGLKANIASPTFTGTVRSVTPATNDNSTCIATTAYYIGQAGTANPLMNNAVSIGTSNLWSRQDHVHPKDTAKAFLSGATFTGNVNISGGTLITGITQREVAYANPTTSVLTGSSNFVFDGSYLCVSYLRETGNNSYLYVDRSGAVTNNTTTCRKYIGLTGTTMTAGTYALDFSAIGGVTGANNENSMKFSVDNVVIGKNLLFRMSVATAEQSASVTRNVTFATTATHCFDIWFFAPSGTACLDYGAIRVKRIC